MSHDGSLLAFVKGNSAKPELSVLDLRNSRESHKLDLPFDLLQLAFSDRRQILFGLDESQQPLVIDLEQAAVDKLDWPQSSQLESITTLRWINGRLLLASGSNIYSFDMSNGTIEQEESFPLDVTSMVGFNWSDRWLAVASGTIFDVAGSTRNPLRLGGYDHRYSSVALSPCTRYMAVALGNGQVEIHHCE